VRIAYDPAKNASNIAKHRLSFDEVPLLDWASAIYRPDTRHDYREKRIRAWLIGSDGKPYSVVHDARRDDAGHQLPSRARKGMATLCRAHTRNLTPS
jgi:uncharacterized DUF497 family protein